MADDELSAELAAITERNEFRIEHEKLTDETITGFPEGDIRRLVKLARAALKFHRPVQLYGLDTACGHDIDAGDWPQHFEADDGAWYCRDKPTVAVCSACVDGEGGERVEWPCDEYTAILAALTGRGKGNA